MRYLTGDVGWDITLQSVIDIVESGETELMLTTNGGNFFEGVAIRDYLKSTNKIKSIGCLGLVASAGTLIMQGVQDRWATPSSKFLIHGVQGGAQGSANDVQKVADELRQLSNEEALNYSLISGKSIEEINKIMDEERILYADEALTLNLINRISNLENFMSKKEDQKSKLDLLAKAFKAVFSFNNLVIQSTDGTELDFGESIESVEQIVVGSPCSQNGEFVLTDGRTIKVEGNVVTEVIEAADTANEEMAQLKAENETLKAQLEATNLKVSELTNKLTEFVNLKKEFLDFKNQFSNETIDTSTAPKVIEPEKPVSRIKITQK